MKFWNTLVAKIKIWKLKLKLRTLEIAFNQSNGVDDCQTIYSWRG